MKKKRRNLKPKILFNASVILAGLYSRKGGSAKLCSFVKTGKIGGVISEVILDEIKRHSNKFKTESWGIVNAPSERTVSRFNKIVIDEGDSHVLASCDENKIRYLVTLDKKHLLVLKGKIKGLRILTPGELIKFLSDK